jgi:hypothetical protein
VRRPRARAADGSGEVALPSYELFSCTEVLGRMALERMPAGPSTRYGHGLEPVGEQVAATAASMSRSAVSRRFVPPPSRSLDVTWPILAVIEGSVVPTRRSAG